MNRTRHVRRAATLACGGLAALLILTACGGPTATPTAPATPPPTPSPTPNPHLADPASIDVLYRSLRERGFEIVGTNAQQGVDPVARINATFEGWPLALAQYSSTQARLTLVPFRDGALPTPAEPPYTFAGINIAVQYGPIVPSAKAGDVPADKVASAAKLAAELDRFIGPLVERSAGRVSPVASAAIPSQSPATSPSP